MRVDNSTQNPPIIEFWAVTLVFNEGMRDSRMHEQIQEAVTSITTDALSRV